MNITKDEKKVEAVKRMKEIGVFPQTIQQFETANYISISEPPFGAFYWAAGEDLQRIREFEEQSNGLVYLVVRSYTEMGRMDCYLFVSDYREEWELEKEDLKNGAPLCYVYNRDVPYFSEYGCIGIERTPAAGLRRTW